MKTSIKKNYSSIYQPSSFGDILKHSPSIYDTLILDYHTLILHRLYSHFARPSSYAIFLLVPTNI